tara:strand:- start:9679 stop:10893 length:1215 start_codon:yes stop_codon:yes gene_type:complete
MKTCCVIGLGYIGLPTAAILSKVGHKVIGVDTNVEVVKKINSGKTHIKEPNLENLVQESVSSNTLSAQSKPSKADIFLITVPTPFIKSNSRIPKPNLDYVQTAARAISTVLEPGNLVIIESTCPVGTTKKIAELIFEETKLNDKQVKLAYCPERVLPGRILEELISNDRVIGGLNPESSDECKSFYQTFCKGEIHITNSETAEMVKLSENAFRDINIAYANELSMICDISSINVNELITLANKHPRVNILNPGCGVGGHCIAVDPWFIASAQPENTDIIQAARLVNEKKTSWVISQIKEKVYNLQNKTQKQINIGCFGLTFKPNIDDIRESPAIKIVTNLIEDGYKVYTCEPNISNHPKISLYTSEEVINCSDILVFLVAHSKFENLETKDRDIVNLCGLKLKN